MLSFFSKQTTRKTKQTSTVGITACAPPRPLVRQGALYGVESFSNPPPPANQLQTILPLTIPTDIDTLEFNETLAREETEEEAAARVAQDIGQSRHDEEQAKNFREKAIAHMRAEGVFITQAEALAALNVITKVCL
jgi:hypothetical protein